MINTIFSCKCPHCNNLNTDLWYYLQDKVFCCGACDRDIKIINTDGFNMEVSA